ncbi:MAG: hypothetical protein DME26_17315, partial [Verrucomicrobia bacterium]
MILRAADLPPSALPGSQTTISQERVSALELDRAIKEVVSRRKYAWRMPREKIVQDDAGKGAVARFFASLAQILREWARTVSNWINELIEKLLRRGRTGSGGDHFGLGWIASVRGLIFLLTALVVCALAILLYRVWRKHQKKTTIAAAEA